MCTPLGTILFFANAITETCSCPESNKYLLLIKSQVAMMQSFMGDLLDFNQLKDGVFSMSREPFSPSEVIQNVCQILGPQAENNQTVLTWSREAGLRPPVEHMDLSWVDDAEDTIPQLVGDKRRLQQVLVNLVKNSTKFTRGGHIHIKACYNRLSGLLIIHVTDTGVGIAQEDLNKLFNRFSKLHKTASINQEGFGLGLNICRQIVEQAGGCIRAYSNGVDRGSQFVFSMHMDVPDAPEQLSPQMLK